MIKACILYSGLCMSFLLTPMLEEQEDVQGIVQVQDDMGKPLEGAEFQLYSYGELKENLKSDETGRILLHGLEQGEYRLIQSRSDYGYRKTKKQIRFVYDGEQKAKQYVHIVNERMLGTVKLRVRTENNKRASNIRMQLLDEQGRKLKTITGDSDLLQLNNLTVGTYCLRLDEGERTYRMKEDVMFRVTPYNYDHSYVLTLYVEAIRQKQIDYTFAFCFITVILLLLFRLLSFFRKHGITQILDDFAA